MAFPLQYRQLTNQQPTPIQHFTIVSVGTCGLPVEFLLQLDHRVQDLKQLCKLLTVFEVNLRFTVLRYH